MFETEDDATKDGSPVSRAIHLGGSCVRYDLSSINKDGALHGLLRQQQRSTVSWKDEIILRQKLLEINHDITCLSLATDRAADTLQSPGGAGGAIVAGLELRIKLRPLKAAALELLGLPCPNTTAAFRAASHGTHQAPASSYS
jgi:hypothetical protein